LHIRDRENNFLSVLWGTVFSVEVFGLRAENMICQVIFS